MNVVRFVSRVSQPLLYSFSSRLAPVLWAPCRTISTDKDQVKFGNVGGKIKDPTGSLEMYLGRWIHDPKQLHEQMQEHEKLQQQVLSEMGLKNYIKYIRNNGTWTVEHGIVGEGETLCYEFVLGQMFITLSPDNNFMKTLVHHDGEYMIWTFHPAETPEEVIQVKTNIKENKLFWKTEYPDGLRTTRVYFRE